MIFNKNENYNLTGEEILQIQADAVREASVYLESQTVTSKTDHYLLNDYADKLERGEHD